MKTALKACDVMKPPGSRRRCSHQMSSRRQSVVQSPPKNVLASPTTAKRNQTHSFRCAVVTTLVNVVHGLRGNHNSMQVMLCNVIHTCTDISSSAHVYLLIDGLELWLAFLHNTDQMTENLLQLFNNIYGKLLPNVVSTSCI